MSKSYASPVSWDNLPPVQEGHTRAFCKCNKCRVVAFYDLPPDPNASRFIAWAIPCSHNPLTRWGDSVTSLSEAEARALTEFPIAATEEDAPEDPVVEWKFTSPGLLY